MMEFSSEKISSYNLISLNGRLDTITSISFEKYLLNEIESNQSNFILDCKNLSYISSAGLRILLLLSKKVKPLNGEVVLVGLQEQIEEVFRISGFDALFRIHISVDEVINKSNQ
ncbi:MAG: STAS domain-containing protein [Ignavibacteriaceae bacterium]|nr:STAS domain-containing protein [Ignavibacteriaceae bacterium]